MQYLTREDRLLKITSVKNIRDLGGYELQSGAFTKSHKYIRSASMHELTRVDKDFLVDYNISTIIDLRGEFERMKAPNAVLNDDNFSYYVVDVFEQQDANIVPENIEFKDMGDLYCIILERSKDQIKKVFEIFYNHIDEGIVFHCSAGKDRTGIIAALLLDLAGCHEYDIVKDYSESYDNNMDINEELEKQIGASKSHYLYSKPTYMMKMINHIRDNYGSSKEYLATTGINLEQIEEIVENFTF